MTIWGCGDLQQYKNRATASFLTWHTPAQAGTHPAHTTNLVVHWALHLANNHVVWLATALRSSPEVIDLDEPSKIVAHALPRVPLRCCESIPIAIACQHTHLRPN